MSLISKLYSYYFTSLFHRNWFKLIFFTLLAIIGAWFLAPFASYYIVGKKVPNFFKHEGKKPDFRELNRLVLNDQEIKFLREKVVLEEQILWDKWEEARKKGDEEGIEKAKEELLDTIRINHVALNTFFFPLPPLQEIEYNELSMGVEPSTSPEFYRWRLINHLSFWALTSGALFSFLTLSLVDFLFLTPKKSGEEALVLNFTPGVKRSDLLISKILVFLTYYSLIGLITFVLPGFFYYLWVGSLAPLNLVWLFLYTILAAPLLAFGLVILPYLLFTNWSSLLGTLFSWTIYTLPLVFYVLAWNSPWTIKVRNWFYNPLFFVPLALGVGIFCLVLYYYQTQKEDLKV